MSVVFTSVLFNDAFHALPDIQQAKLSAQRVSKLLTQLPSIDAMSNNGTTLVSITCTQSQCVHIVNIGEY